MMIDIQAVQIDFGATGQSEVLQNLNTLYTTPVGTVPFDRIFGIDNSIIDLPIEIAKGRLTIEYIEKTEIYEPRAVVREVIYSQDANKGTLIPKVVIDIVDE